MSGISVMIIFLLLTLMAIPVGYVMGLTAMVGLLDLGGPDFLRVLATRFHSGAEGFVLIAIPFFILAAELMNRAGITRQLIDFSDALVGHFKGGLSHVNIVVSIFFAGLTGAAVTDTVAVGGILIPEMKREGYSSGYSAAVTAVSSVLGPIIPPSIVMVLYSTILRDLSVASLFAAGIIPGLLIGIFLLIVSVIMSHIRDYPRKKRASMKELWSAARKAGLALLTPVIIIGGILTGMMEVSEAAALGAFYSLFLGVVVFRKLKWKDVWGALTTTAAVAGSVFLLLITAHVLSWWVTRSGIARVAAQFIVTASPSPIVQMLLVNIFLLIVGMFLDTIPAVLILAPILAPPMAQLGFDPLHFAIVMLVNLNLGNATPPVGMTLMTATRIARIPYERAMKDAIPFVLAGLAVVLLISYIPAIPLWIPRMLGLSW